MDGRYYFSTNINTTLFILFHVQKNTTETSNRIQCVHDLVSLLESFPLSSLHSSCNDNARTTSPHISPALCRYLTSFVSSSAHGVSVLPLSEDSSMFLPD